MTNKNPICEYGGTLKQIQTGDFVNPSNVLYPPGYINGLNFTWNSATQITVAAGSAVDSTQACNMTLSTAQTLVGFANYGVLGGADISGAITGTVTGSGTTITGSGTSFFTAFNPISQSGTISNSGTTVTGTSTSFLGNVAVGDLIGNSTKGYYLVTAVASNTSLTINTTPSSSFSSASWNVIQQLIVEPGSGTTYQVTTITSNTSLTTAVSVGTVSSTTLKAGGFCSNNTTSNTFYHVFLVSNGSTFTGVLLSTQRTTPYMIGGSAYSPALAYYRRIGAVMVDASGSGNILGFIQYGSNNDRTYLHNIQYNSNNLEVANTVAPGSWTTYSAAPAVAPTGYAMVCNLSAGGGDASLRPANSGASFSSLSPIICTTFSMATCMLDGAQNFQALNASADSLTVVCAGWMERV